MLRTLTGQWNGPWLCGGDFNEILSGEEKRGGQLRDESEIRAFHEGLLDSNLRDVGYEGYQFIWENRRWVGGYIEELLGRFVASEVLMRDFPRFRVKHLDRTRSDHRPVICDTEGEEDEEPRWGWSFRFDPFWIKIEESAKVVG
ncbi:unnamed protein product [Linum trigynum]|uniref:Uncharacterized protein n=1 Tax=Linum trigynum TaxID=586398 RepID=A0AAV2GXD2_9ROSI